METAERQEKRRQLQLEAIKSLAGFFEKGICWISGGWAVEFITGIHTFHEDIDLYFLDEIPDGVSDKSDFLDIHVVLRQADGSYRQATMGGVLRFSEYAFEPAFRTIGGISVKTVSPELLFAFADGSPDPRCQEKRTLQLLRDIDINKVDGIIRYLPGKK
jgi:hypothetical protein